ncbi:CRISPR-associated protein Cas4 [Vulcanisaeta sp. JCM 14467]|uniref:CRISPR-associated protein Cas4 n=1 Tax=Vulcanisaeta sp. JCM 14467 TaxID=1295370 RepID=UPI002092D918|nr:CRISPR-associated protein Cas4 [Vulcanisaeta sp. JCM 14467]
MPQALKSSSPQIPIALIKEFTYCPRYAYYLVFMRGINYVTESMEAALEGNADLDKAVRELCGGASNVLREYPVYSRSLGIYGRIDYVCLYHDHAVPIEVKWLSRVSRRSLLSRHRHYLMQAVAYSMAVEETLRTVVKHFVILTSGGHLIIELTPALKSALASLVKELRLMIANERLPKGVNDPRKCNYCAFRRLCRLA